MRLTLWLLNITALSLTTEQGSLSGLLSGDYVEVESSPTFPQVPKERLIAFLEQAKEDESAAIRELRAWFEE